MQFHDFKTKKILITHPQALKEIKKDFEITTSKKPLEFSKDTYYLGEIPRKNNFEKGTHGGEEIPDDSAIAIKSPNGVIVITGCSHSGICNICEYAKEVTGQKLHAVIGGFHLFEDDQETVNKTIEYFKKEDPKFLYPMHCVDFPTLAKFHSIFGIQKISAGETIEF